MNPLQVAVGVVKNPEGKILISLRHADLHQGGLWEFPGGKIEPSETAESALARELKEELNIDRNSGKPADYHPPPLPRPVRAAERFLGRTVFRRSQKLGRPAV